MLQQQGRCGCRHGRTSKHKTAASVMSGQTRTAHKRLAPLLAQAKVGYLDARNLVAKRHEQVLTLEVKVDQGLAVQVVEALQRCGMRCMSRVHHGKSNPAQPLRGSASPAQHPAAP